MYTRLPEVGDKVLIVDHYAHTGATTIAGISPTDPRLVIVHPVGGLNLDFSKPVRFADFPRSGHWSWPEPGDKLEHAPPPRPKVLLVPPQR
ncbi:hypothetical protein [Singulisphaera sp. PoT]|uniref:hypothetical protein n=1 Tax=Singulisphaera sp. PoT TaxID=3411797 RepID=UPI003BF60832